MATERLKALPAFSVEDDYLSWKNDINVWQMFTNLDKNKQGSAVYLEMTGRPREAVTKFHQQNLVVMIDWIKLSEVVGFLVS